MTFVFDFLTDLGFLTDDRIENMLKRLFDLLSPMKGNSVTRVSYSLLFAQEDPQIYIPVFLYDFAMYVPAA